MADGAVLSLPQHHQADDYDRSNGHRNDQQANEGTAAQTEVLPQLRHGFLKQQGRCVSPSDHGHSVRDGSQEESNSVRAMLL